MTVISSRVARLALLVDLIDAESFRSQTELAARLAAMGIEVSQPTLSKDLVEVGASRIRDVEGNLVYAIGGRDPRPVAWDRLARLCPELVLSAVGTGNVAIVKTPPGAAQFFASALDKVGWPAVLGTIAGDDTVAIYAADPQGGSIVAVKLRALSEGRSDD